MGSDVNKVILRGTIMKLNSDRMVSWARDAKKTGFVADTAVLLPWLDFDSIAIAPRFSW